MNSPDWNSNETLYCTSGKPPFAICSQLVYGYFRTVASAETGILEKKMSKKNVCSLLKTSCLLSKHLSVSKEYLPFKGACFASWTKGFSWGISCEITMT